MHVARCNVSPAASPSCEGAGVSTGSSASGSALC